ncbi:hypothetical protein [Paraburkholderia fungorum]|uniref:hypothetical protein n=1 Tax=Paraburkholderia fungorum TaxID=134537 RepID=UPI0038BB1891
MSSARSISQWKEFIGGCLDFRPVGAIKQWLAEQPVEDFRLHYEKFSDSNSARAA